MSDLNETPVQFATRLRATFAEEAAGHVRELDAGLRSIEHGKAAEQVLPRMLATLHTLKGAARAVELTDLELLCHAMESMCLAWQRGDVADCAAAAAALTESCDLVMDNLVQPDGRTRNRTMAQVQKLLLLSDRTA